MAMSLPQEIGRTEHALEMLLAKRVLAGTRLRTSEEWVAVNLLDRLMPTEGVSWGVSVAAALSMTAREAGRLVARLRAIGVAVESDQGLVLSDAARRDLGDARLRTARIADEIDRTVPAADREATVRTLDAVRTVVQRFDEGELHG